jgi:hypothetical protein
MAIAAMLDSLDGPDSPDLRAPPEEQKNPEVSIKIAAGVVGGEAKRFTLWYLVRDKPSGESDPLVDARWLFVHDTDDETPPALTTMLYAHSDGLEAFTVPWKKTTVLEDLLAQSVSLGLQQCGTLAGPRLVLGPTGDALDDEDVVREIYDWVRKRLEIVASTETEITMERVRRPG